MGTRAMHDFVNKSIIARSRNPLACPIELTLDFTASLKSTSLQTCAATFLPFDRAAVTIAFTSSNESV